MQLFSEIFPVEKPPVLTAYTLRLVDLPPDTPPVDLTRLGRSLAIRLRRRLPEAGGWFWRQDRLLTDADPLLLNLTEIVTELQDASPELFGVLAAVDADFAWQPAPELIADFVIRTRLDALDEPLNAALAKFNRDLTPTIRVEREYRAQAWNAAGHPAVSLSVAARLTYTGTAQTFAAEQGDAKTLIGLRAADQTSGFTGEIVKISGTVGERRDKLLKAAKKDALTRLIDRAADDEWAVRVEDSSSTRLELPARALELLVRPTDFALFGVDETAVDPLLRPDPAARSLMIKALADIARDAGVLGKAFSAREYPALFVNPEFEPYLRYAGNRSRPYHPPALPLDFVQCGAYHLREVFRQQPIRVGVVNALPTKIDDFVEALQRQLTRTFEFKVEVLRERKVRVVSPSNIESAVRVLEKEQPDIILAFIPNTDAAQTAPDGEDLPVFVKSLTLGRGIPGYVIFEKTLDDPEAMPGIIMAMLARTGNTPFALADPLDQVDFVVGLDVVRITSEDDKTRTTPGVTAVARIYRSSGAFVRYAVRQTELTGGTQGLFVLMRDLFPQRDFAGKRVILHHDGRLDDDIRQALLLWGQALKTGFYPVEVLRRGAPRLYAFAENRVQSPPWGSYFRLNDHEAFVILSAEESSTPDAAVPSARPNQRRDQRSSQPHSPTPQPLHVLAGTLPVELAVRSLQLWTLLYYGTGLGESAIATRLPVTLYGAGELAYWIRKGGLIQQPEGEVPFWL